MFSLFLLLGLQTEKDIWINPTTSVDVYSARLANSKIEVYKATYSNEKFQYHLNFDHVFSPLSFSTTSEIIGGQID
jgi:hypothetical protein